jgi:hypothetical protein
VWLCKFDTMPVIVWSTTPRGLGSGVGEKATMSPLSPVDRGTQTRNRVTNTQVVNPPNSEKKRAPKRPVFL